MSRTTTLTVVLRALDAFVKRDGHACVPQDYIEQGLRLGDAVDHLRQLHASGTLPATAAARLESRSGWTWEPGHSANHKFISAVGEFIAFYGHGAFKAGSELATAANCYRDDLAAGRVDEHNFRALESFPQWKWETRSDHGWNDKFKELKALVEEQGHPAVPVDRKPLASWTHYQRAKHRAGDLLPSRQCRLEMLKGWAWQPAMGMRERYLAELEEYVAANGSADVPENYVTAAGFALGASLKRIRRLHRNGELPAHRAAALEAIAGWSWGIGVTQKQLNEQALAALRAFVAREGHATVPVIHIEDGFPLGANLVAARYRLRKGLLGAGRRQALDAIDEGWRRGAQPPAADGQELAA